MQPVQIKMARAALGLSVDELASHAGVSATALASLEKGEDGDPEATQGLNLFFASNGIELIGDDGVRAKQPLADEFVTVEQLTTENDGGEG